MNTVKARIGSATCLVLALGWPTNAQEKQPAQTKESPSHRMEVYNGPYRTVYYFSDGASADEQAKLRDAERHENEAAVSDQLNALLRQYLADESVLQRRRRNVQLLYYGHSNVVSERLIGGQVVGGPPYSFDGFYGYYGYYGYGYVPGTVTSTNGLFGVGDEGPIKAELSKALTATLVPRGAVPPPAPK